MVYFVLLMHKSMIYDLRKDSLCDKVITLLAKYGKTGLQSCDRPLPKWNFTLIIVNLHGGYYVDQGTTLPCCLV